MCICLSAWPPAPAALTPACPQVSVLVFIALAFLTCVVFLVVYKVYKYERLCPDGFILKVKPHPLGTQHLSHSQVPGEVLGEALRGWGQGGRDLGEETPGRAR